MKRLSAILAAALIALSVSLPVFAEPDQSSEEQTSVSQSSQKNSKTESKSEDIDADSIQYESHRIESVGMSLDIPKDMYVVTPGMDENDPTLKACKLSKKDVDENFQQSNIQLRAYATDFSYDITVQTIENERTKAIGDLAQLADAEVENIINNLISSEYASGCSKNVYNNVLYLTLDKKYNAGETEVYVLQEYTIVKGANVIITLQSYSGEMSKDLEKLLGKIMESVVYEGVGIAQLPADVGEKKVTQLDTRYFWLAGACVLAILALSGIIIVAVRYRHSGENEDDSDYGYGEDDDSTVEVSYEPAEKKNGSALELEPDDKAAKENDVYKDTTLFVPADENVIYKNEKLDEEKRKKEETRSIPRLDATTELEIPENPYTPVGKAEAVAQPALSVTSEIAKLSEISAQAKKEAEEKAVAEERSKPDDNSVVFAESAPKAKTDIEQIGEDVLASDEPEEKTAEPENEAEELSEYEKRFGKNRITATTASPLVPVDEDEKRISKFEKRFGKPTPAVPEKPEEGDRIAAVDTLFAQENKEDPTDAAKESEQQSGSEQELSPAERTAARQSFFGKLFSTGAEDDIYEDDEPEQEIGTEETHKSKESTNKFLSNIKEKLEQRHEREEETEISAPVVSDSTEKTKSPEKTDNASETSAEKQDEESSGEIYRSPEPEKNPPEDGKIALSFKKDENGNIIIDQISGKDGAPVQVEIKDGTAEAKARAEQRDKEDQERRKNKSASKAEKKRARKEAERLKREEEKRRAAEETAAKGAEVSEYEKRFGSKKDDSKPQAATVPETVADSGLSDYEKKFGKGKAAAGVAVGAAAGAAAAGVAAAGTATVSGAAEVASGVSGITAGMAAGAVVGTVATEQTEETQTEQTAEIAAQPEQAEEVIAPAAEIQAESVEDISAAELLGVEIDTPAVPVEEDQTEEKEEIPAEPVRPAFIFERDAGIIFEKAPDQQPISVGADTPFTHIPRLESVNADDYNREFEALRNAAKSDPAPADKTEFEKRFGTTKAVAPQQSYGAPVSGYDDGMKDPFAPGSGLEEEPEEPAKRSGGGFGSKLKRSIGKLFSSADEETDE